MDHILTYNDEERTLSEWAEHTGLPYSVIYGRMRLGWSADKIFNTPIQEPTTLPYKGREVTIKELSDLTGIRRTTLYSRLRDGKVGKALIRPQVDMNQRPQVDADEFREWLFNYIVAYKHGHDGISPTLQEIETAAQEDYFGISSSFVRYGLAELRRRERIDYEHRQPRSIQVVGGEWRYEGCDYG